MLYKVLVFILNIVLRLVYRVRVHGNVELLEEEGYLICSNHGHILDPVFFFLVFKKKINFMGKEELFQNKFMAFILPKVGVFSVNRDGNDVRALKTAIKILKDGRNVGLFIEGTRVKEINIENAKPGAVMIANIAKTNIIPVHISTTYRLFSRIDIYIRDVKEIDKIDFKALGSDGYEIVAQDILKEIYNI